MMSEKNEISLLPFYIRQLYICSELYFHAIPLLLDIALLKFNLAHFALDLAISLLLLNLYFDLLTYTLCVALETSHGEKE